MTPEPFRAAPPMYKQVADHLAAKIIDGELPAGSELPSETDLVAEFGVSRPTVRSAMAELRAMGLVDSTRGKRSAVRSPVVTAAVTVERSVSRSGKTYRTGSGDQWQDAEQPTVTRTHTSGTTAELLERDGEQALTVDRLLTDATGTRAAHRLTIPFEVASEVPVLAENPDRMALADIYAALTTTGQALTWRETVSARAPHPDERTSLRLTDNAAPILLVTHRVTLAADGRPLLLEELRVSADQVNLAFTITTTKAPARPRQ